ncbi:tRNA pseudouridine38/39 synthase [Paragonimus westermani]|uniref:tRNA pseudouridine synthase n=1 Tax=Paragonimus westermani TaxID=34504 RepID=A0A5J4NX15_9TREM|nr:tRNA pseudouridine38/39 synthase [Paragonimus westermani]
MRRVKDLEEGIEALKKLSFEDLLKHAIQQERRNFELENVLSKCQDDDSLILKKKRHFAFQQYKMRHIALQFAYLGWNYSGLALQGSAHPATVMQKLLDALEKCKLIEDRESSNFTVCGRTDKGVSALGQVVSVVVRSALLSGLGVIEDSGPDAEKRSTVPNTELDYVYILNKVLPADIRILAWSPTHPGFNARFTCLRRSYTYYLPCSGLDLVMMKKAALQLVGTHDFRNICSVQVETDTPTFVRRIDNVMVHPLEADPVCPTTMCQISVSASGFLYHQIRCIVSVLVMIGRGYEPVSLIEDLLDISKTPSKPQYQIAGDIPLLFTDAEYPEDSLHWYTSEAAQLELIRHFQKLWSEHAIRSTTVKTLLDHVERRWPRSPLPLYHLDRIIPEGRWREERVCGKGSHKPLCKRPIELTVEERLSRFKRKKIGSEDESALPNDHKNENKTV